MFYILIGVISLTVAGVFYLAGGELNSTAGLVMASSYMFIPTIASLIIVKFIYKEEKIKEKLFISFKFNRWFLVAWLIAPVIAFTSIGVALLFSDVSYSPEMEGMFDRFESVLTAEQMQEMRESADSLPFHPIWLTLLSGLLAGITINAIFGLGEEIGWRGFLLRRFIGQKFAKAALVIGFVWGVWHFPIILMGHNYPTYPLIGVFMMIIWCILLSPLFLYITIKARSVIAAGIMHGTLNGTAGVSLLVLQGGNELLIGMTGLSGFIALSFFTLIFFLYDRYISKERVMLRNIDMKR